MGCITYEQWHACGELEKLTKANAADTWTIQRVTTTGHPAEITHRKQNQTASWKPGWHRNTILGIGIHGNMRQVGEKISKQNKNWVQSKAINECFGWASDMGLKSPGGMLLLSAPHPQQWRQVLPAKFRPISTPPSSWSRTVWLVLANELWSEVMHPLGAATFKSWCSALQLALPLWHAWSHVWGQWSHQMEAA